MAQHPFVPETLELPGYVSNFLSVTHILAGYGVASLGVVISVWFLSGKFRHLIGVERLLMCWWAFTGLTHFILEGYFVFTPDFYKKTTPIFLAEVWKEYSKGDSRYAARDSAVVVVEGITSVLEGPASLLAVYAIATRKPYRDPLQLAVCLGQLYGCIVYFVTAQLDGIEYAVGPFYYWFYYIFMNYIWVVIPSIIAWRSWRRIVHQFENKRGKSM
ncbi:hypothetical protein L7F22_011518 [Adiantum nelumboides]|nr:hypothetical protein [Adiantum nelumboides]